MQDYNFWADFLLTFKSSPDWIKALWLLVPPGFVLALIAIILRFRLALQREQPLMSDMIVPLHYRNESLSEADETLMVIPPTPLCPVTYLVGKGSETR